MSGTVCCYSGCKKSYSTDKDVSFFKFPDDPKRRTKWMQSCGNLELQNLSDRQLRGKRICSDHFILKSFMRPESRTSLKDNAVPIAAKEEVKKPEAAPTPPPAPSSPVLRKKGKSSTTAVGVASAETEVIAKKSKVESPPTPVLRKTSESRASVKDNEVTSAVNDEDKKTKAAPTPPPVAKSPVLRRKGKSSTPGTPALGLAGVEPKLANKRTKVEPPPPPTPVLTRNSESRTSVKDNASPIAAKDKKTPATPAPPPVVSTPALRRKGKSSTPVLGLAGVEPELTSKRAKFESPPPPVLRKNRESRPEVKTPMKDIAVAIASKDEKTQAAPPPVPVATSPSLRRKGKSNTRSSTPPVTAKKSKPEPQPTAPISPAKKTSMEAVSAKVISPKAASNSKVASPKAAGNSKVVSPKTAGNSNKAQTPKLVPNSTPVFGLAGIEPEVTSKRPKYIPPPPPVLRRDSESNSSSDEYMYYDREFDFENDEDGKADREFERFHAALQKYLRLPAKWTIGGVQWDPQGKRKVIIFSEPEIPPNGRPCVKRCLQCFEDKSIRVFIDQMDMTDVFGMTCYAEKEDVAGLITRIADASSCCGVPEMVVDDLVYFPNVRKRNTSYFDPNCPGVIPNDAYDPICTACKDLQLLLMECRQKERNRLMERRIRSEQKNFQHPFGQALYSFFEDLADETDPSKPKKKRTKETFFRKFLHDTRYKVNGDSARTERVYIEKPISVDSVSQSFQDIVSKLGFNMPNAKRRPTGGLLPRPSPSTSAARPGNRMLPGGSSALLNRKLSMPVEHILPFTPGSSFTLDDGQEYELIGEVEQASDFVEMKPTPNLTPQQQQYEIIEVDDETMARLSSSKNQVVMLPDSASLVPSGLPITTRIDANDPNLSQILKAINTSHGFKVS